MSDDSPGGLKEGLQSKHLDPLDAQEMGFDWETLYRRLGEAESENPEWKPDLVKSFTTLSKFVIGENLKASGAEKKIARRFIGLIWALNPGLIEGSPSLRQIAKDLRICPPALSRYSAEASRRFDITNRSQAHAWNFKPSEKPT